MEAMRFFDRSFALKLKSDEMRDLVAYLKAIGDADQPFEPATRQSEMEELAAYVTVLDRAIDQAAIDLVVDTVRFDLARIATRFSNRSAERNHRNRPDRPDVATLAAILGTDMEKIGELARSGKKAEVQAMFAAYRLHARELVSAYP